MGFVFFPDQPRGIAYSETGGIESGFIKGALWTKCLFGIGRFGIEVHWMEMEAEIRENRYGNLDDVPAACDKNRSEGVTVTI